LPSEQTVQQMFGKSYDPERTLNVLKMFAGTEDLCEATMGIVKAMFAAKGIDPKTREMIILRAAKVPAHTRAWHSASQLYARSRSA
jgi:alkylhydroperoxidase family enzyme